MGVRLAQVVLDTTDARSLAEFYRLLLGWTYRPGHEPPPDGPDRAGNDWLNLDDPEGGTGLAFQQVERMPRPTWPESDVPQQLHLDLTTTGLDELFEERDRVLGLGATVLEDRSADEGEPLYVFADPQGHPFCIFVA